MLILISKTDDCSLGLSSIWGYVCIYAQNECTDFLRDTFYRISFSFLDRSKFKIYIISMYNGDKLTFKPLHMQLIK